MNAIKPTRTEWISFFILMPVIDIVTVYIMFGEKIWHEPDVLLSVFFLNYVIGICVFFLNVFSMHKFQQAMPDLKQTVKRVILIVITHIVVTIVVFYIVFIIYEAIAFF